VVVAEEGNETTTKKRKSPEKTGSQPVLHEALSVFSSRGLPSCDAPTAQEAAMNHTTRSRDFAQPPDQGRQPKPASLIEFACRRVIAMILDAAKSIPIESEIARRGIRLAGHGIERAGAVATDFRSTPQNTFGTAAVAFAAATLSIWFSF
jgi:hypothetical protein